MASVSTCESGRLNTFQRVMCQWCQLHPYNAAHVYKLAGPLRLDALQTAIQEAYAFNGLGIAEVSENMSTYHFETDPAVPAIAVLSADDAKSPEMARHLAGELNRPFERPRCRPVRYSVVPESGESHYLIATYDHWIGDSIAARLLLRHVLGRYLDLDIPENQRPLELYPPTYRDVFAQQFGARRLGTTTARSLGRWLRNQVACRVARVYDPQMPVGCTLGRTEPGSVSRLVDFAHSLGATVHDAILAAMARAMAHRLPTELLRRRPEVAIGSIVNTRQDAQKDLSETLGLFLGFLLIRCSADRRLRLADVTRQVAAMTRANKAGRHYLDSLVNLKLFDTVWPLLGDKKRRDLVRQGMPMTAGLTNVLIRNTWIDRYGQGRILDYFRAAPAGPMLPLVLGLTTFGDHMTLAVTYRCSCFAPEQSDAILEMLIEQLEHPQEPPGAVRVGDAACSAVAAGSAGVR